MADAAPQQAAPASPHYLRVLALVCGAFSTLLGLITSVAWLLDIPAFVQIHPSVAPMVLNTALCFLMAGVGLMALGMGSTLGSSCCGVVIAALAVLTLIPYLTSPDLRIDQLVSGARFMDPRDPARPLRMAPNTATAFLLVGLALAFAGRRGRSSAHFVAGGAAGVAVLSLSTVALAGYSFGIQPAFGWGRMIAMSPQSAVGLAIVGLAVVFVVGRPDLTVAHHRQRWLAFLVGAAGATTTLLLWQALAADQEKAVQTRVDAETLAIRDALSSSLKSNVDALARLAHRWERRATPLREEWEDDAGSYVKDFPAYLTIAWADPQATVRWIAPRAGNEQALGTDLMAEAGRRAAIEAARTGNRPTIAGSMELLLGGRGFGVLVPLAPHGGMGGFFTAEFRGAAFLDSVLSAESRSNHRISLLLGGEPLALATPPSSLSKDLGSRTAWPLLGQEWSVEVVPTVSWARRRQSVLPLGVLCGGLLFSVLLAWSVLKTGEARLTVLAVERAHHDAEEHSKAVSLINDQIVREIAERRSAEHERDRFFSLSIDMLCISNADGYFKRLNPAFEQTLGYTVQELTTRPFLDFVHPDDVASTLAEVEKQVARGIPTMHFENRYRCKDGTYRWLEWKSMPDVESGMMYALARDVTKEKLTADRLRDSEQRYRGLVEAATDIIYRTNPAGDFTFVNAVAARVMGYSEKELLGMNFSELVRPDQRDEVRKWYEAQTSGRTAATQREFLAVAKDGREIWIEQTVQTVVENDRIVALQAIARDVTVRKGLEAERERLRSEQKSTLAEVRTLSSLLPMCSGCRRIRDDEDGSWNQLELYLDKKKSGTRVSHGICPECTRELYPDHAQRMDARQRGEKA